MTVKGDSSKSGEKTVVAGLLLLVLYPSWFRGGTRIPVQWPMICLAALLLVSMLLFFARFRRNSGGTAMRDLLQDPILYMGGFFLLLLSVQWWNAGRDLILDWERMKWIYGPPRINWMPSAINPADAAEMLRWFFPAYVAVMATRHGIQRAGTVRLFLTSLCASASLLAFLGACQWLAARVWHVGLPPSESYFFTSFGYANHAGIFFVLMFCLSLGLLIDSVIPPGTRWPRGVFPAVMTLLTFAGVSISAGRAALILSWVAAVSGGFYFLWISWRTCSRVAFVNRVSGVAAILLLGFFAVHGFGQNFLREEFGPLSRSAARSHEEGQIKAVVDRFMTAGGFGDRVLQRTLALDIWRENPWFGAGGWCQRYLAPTYLREDEWAIVTDDGLANTHCDPLQFLSEFGAVGFGLLTLITVFLIKPSCQRGLATSLREPLLFMPLLGIGMTFAYSFVDLPFRSPAILYAWAVIPACLPKLRE